VGHFGFVLFAKASKPIWPAPATARFDFSAEKSKLQKEFYTGDQLARIVTEPEKQDYLQRSPRKVAARQEFKLL